MLLQKPATNSANNGYLNTSIHIIYYILYIIILIFRMLSYLRSYFGEFTKFLQFIQGKILAVSSQLT